MRKVILFICLLFMFSAVNAETLEFDLTNNNENNYVFDMLVKDVKNTKINVISGVVSYDESVFNSFELNSQNGWDLQTVKDGNKVKFILTHMTNYVVENQRVMGVSTKVKDTTKDISITLDSIVSSSNESPISVSNVAYKHEPYRDQVEPDNNVNVQVPDEDLVNKVEEEKEEVKEETVDDKKEEKNEEIDSGKKTVRTRDIISLIISFLVFGVVIAAGIFAYKENKKDGGK